ncbi:PH domain-containing protein [Nocardia sp. CT2-14]|uniref:PH domain-containing protein n=1 Tax=Nocardia aurantiaca TaxID=2675850 RepID=A0A6I3L3D1_9NOCA|nr:PH domain-containing protein [Nocardia aurantiaca]
MYETSTPAARASALQAPRPAQPQPASDTYPEPTPKGHPVRATLLVLALLVWALRDVVRPVRLAADAEGVTVVTGFLGRRHLGWGQIERIRVDRRSHRGLRSEFLEVDAGDAIYLFSANDLGELPDEVATALADLRVSPA